MRKIIKATPICMCFLSFLSFADSENTENHISVGAVFGDFKGYNIVDQSVKGFGINYARINDGSNLGFIFSLQNSKAEKTYLDLDYGSISLEYKITSFSIGPIYHPSSINWLKLYVDIGGTYFDVKVKEKQTQLSLTDDDLWFNYSIGAQIRLPKTPVFIDASYKSIHTSGNYSGLDIKNHFFLGAGYSF
ncbi:outer membrane beta-barrel protein [Vibrio coralliirubri]|uniref:outer membrane beta-barrel protein n=1 Tax=Vibrio coralliirubri TaxID=1516159 RepID=UPI000630532F|nr:outer membrane beta-barrel protein [Vibrio coralliirubri]CDT20195.1 putative Attachment invasion locus protein [Vibrio coralliirubri]CDT60454.1 putative Attachment invasion locus protein [Vibrio coralliirubri]CDT78915.1 putative Attachment invasion locus protein [Vibrio coralliirubri]CDT91681.1 putative Attachment invasion locus protein [Vibrio coralliirubri]